MNKNNLNIDKEFFIRNIFDSSISILQSFDIPEIEIREALRRLLVSMGESEEDLDDLSDEEYYDEEEISSYADKYLFLHDLEKTKEYRAVNRVLTRLNNFPDVKFGKDTIAQIFNYAEELNVTYSNLIKFVVNVAKEKGVKVVESKKNWIAMTSDEELDKLEQIIFLDERYELGLYTSNTLYLLCQQFLDNLDKESLIKFLNILENTDCEFDADLKRRVSEGIVKIQDFKKFFDYVITFKDMGEIIRSDFVKRYVIDNIVTEEYYLEYWLDKMARDNIITLYKKSGRYRFTVN